MSCWAVLGMAVAQQGTAADFDLEGVVAATVPVAANLGAAVACSLEVEDVRSHFVLLAIARTRSSSVQNSMLAVAVISSCTAGVLVT